MAARAKVRIRFVLGTTAAVLGVAAGLAAVLFVAVKRWSSSEVEAQVRSDARLARTVYDEALRRLESDLEAACRGRSLRFPPSEEDLGDFGEVLRRWRSRAGFDVLTLVGPDGLVVHRAGRPGATGDDLSDQVLVARVLRERRPVAGTLVLPSGALEMEDPTLAERAFVTVEASEGDATPVRADSTDGLALAAAVPLFDAADPAAPPAVLYGARLLHRRVDLVEAIEERVFGGGSRRAGKGGVAALFLDDVRVAASVGATGDERAIGSRMGEAARRHVLAEGDEWAAREPAFGGWYAGAYEPLRDAAGRVVGALYVGRPEAPYARALRATLATALGALSLATFGVLALLLRVFGPRRARAAARATSVRPRA